MNDGRTTDGSVVGFVPLGFDERAKFPGWDVAEYEEVMGPPPTPARVKRRRAYIGLAIVAVVGVGLVAGGDDDSEQPPASVTPTSPSTFAPEPQEGFEGVGNTLAPVVRDTTPETVVVTLMPPPSE